MKLMKPVCPVCGCRAVYKQEDYGSDDYVTDGLFCKKCQEWIAKTSVSKMHFDKTRYKLTFSLRDVSKRGKDQILSMCGEHLKQRLWSKENISITNNAEAIFGIIQGEVDEADFGKEQHGDYRDQ